MKISVSDRSFIDNAWQNLDSKLIKIAVKSRNKIPQVSINGEHNDLSSFNRIAGWTNGFWGGLMWIMYAGTNNLEYKITAEKSGELLDQAFLQVDQLNHDVGFMWHITSGAEYTLTGNKKARNRNLLASMILASRYEAKGEFIRAWNDTWRDMDTTGWTIIDCMMNIAQLYWASEITGDMRFRRIAEKHADMTMKDHVRENGSVNHIVVHDSEKSNTVLRIEGGQGFSVGTVTMKWVAVGSFLSCCLRKSRNILTIPSMMF